MLETLRKIFSVAIFHRNFEHILINDKQVFDPPDFSKMQKVVSIIF